MFPSLQRRPYGFEPRAKLYDVARGSREFLQRLKLDRRLEVHSGCVNTICWNDQGQYLLSGSDDQHLVITNPFTQRTVVSIRSGHRSNIFSAKFLPNSRDRHVVSCSGVGRVFFTEVDREDTYGKNRFDCHNGTTYEVMVVPNEAATFLTCGEDGTVRWFDLRMKTSCSKESCKDDILINCKQAVTSLAVDPVIPYHLAVACSDSSVRVFDRRMMGTRASGNYTGRGITGMICRFMAPLEHKAYRITSLNYSPAGHDILVSYSSENIYLFSTQDERRRQELSKLASAQGDSSASGGMSESTSSDTTSRQPPIKRLRLRGDWSDTGPNARPERERIQDETGRQSPHATLMQRMSEMLTRWLDGTLRNSDDDQAEGGQEAGQGPPLEGQGQPGTSRSQQGEGQAAESTVSGAQENSDGESLSVSQAAESEQVSSQSMSSSGPFEVNTSSSKTNSGVEGASGGESEDLGLRKPSSSQESCPSIPDLIDSSIKVRPKRLNSVEESSTTSMYSSPSTDEPMSTPSERSSSTTDTLSSSVRSGSSAGIEPDRSSGGADIDCKIVRRSSDCDPTSLSSKSDSMTAELKEQAEEEANPPAVRCDASSVVSDCSSKQTDLTSQSHATTRQQTLSAIPTNSLSSTRQSDSDHISGSGIPPSVQTLLEPVISLQYSSQGMAASTIRVGFAPFDRLSTGESAITRQTGGDNYGSSPAESGADNSQDSIDATVLEVTSTIRDEFKTSSDAESRIDLDDSSSSSLDKQVEAMEIDPSSRNTRSDITEVSHGDDISNSQSLLPELDRKSVERQHLAEAAVSPELPTETAAGGACARVVMDRADSRGKAGRKSGSEDKEESSGNQDDGVDCGGSEEMVTYTESESGEDRQGSDRAEHIESTGRQPAVGRGGSTSGRGQQRSGSREDDWLHLDSSSEEDDINPRPFPSRSRTRLLRDDDERHFAALRLQTAYRKRQEEKEQQEMKHVFQPKTKIKFRGHRNARTMIKEANFWGEDFVMSGSDCGHIFVWDRHTSALVMLLEADRHVVNCLQPHPFDPILASSGIDYDVKVWSPMETEPAFDEEKAHEIQRRNEIMLEETRDTITVPAAFMLRVLASLNQIRAGGNRGGNRDAANRESSSDSD
ncbi:DDB1- and CUL4-associated factor 6-like [Haliotis cracherodii]|uniref:DDB1- and CUL4-associated factor 6-like n=1 Tax=Haliotis cracherodii TaxID=6455 RepID=UPI0039EAD29D